MAVQLNYLAKKGWKPRNEDKDYLITLIKVEFSKSALSEAKKGKKKAASTSQPSLKEMLEEARKQTS